jgi:uncharacterized damage-inducible protein DinB
MDALRHVRLMADYNRWMNQRLHAAAATLDAAALAADRGAFFGSILGTLNHLATTDCLWLRRFQSAGNWSRLHEADDWLPRPTTLRDTLAEDLPTLQGLRERLDDLIVAWSEELIFNDLDRVIGYRNMGGERFQRQVGPLLSHLFNHQTHHRGQVSTLLFQAGVDVGVTDLIAMPGFDPFTAVADDDDSDIPPMPASLVPPG